MDGVQEEAAAFEEPDYRLALVGTPFEGVKRFRSLGEQGPMYEILRIDAQTVHVEVFDNREVLDLPIAEALADPLAT